MQSVVESRTSELGVLTTKTSQYPTVDELVIIGYDPGLASGVAAVAFTPGSDARVLFSAEEEWESSITTVIALSLLYPQAMVAIEKYTITIATAKKSQQPYSLWCIGAVAWALGTQKMSSVIKLQTPADAKRFTSNQQLRTLGLWHRGGEGHANDALRHTVLAAARTGWVPPYDDLHETDVLQ